jgi:hypothetical protein
LDLGSIRNIGLAMKLYNFCFSLVISLPVVAQTTPESYHVDQSSQQDVSVTVYNNNYGLIREVRQVNLPVGEIELEFRDVAQQIDPTSVAFRSLKAAGKLQILEQNYRFDLLNRHTLLDRYVGRELTFIRYPADGQDREERVGTLMSSAGDLIVRFGQEIEINPPGTIALAELPQDLLARPTLVWLLDNQHKGKQKVETSYLTNGMSWHADYVAILDKDDVAIDLTAWVTLENRSGAGYRNAVLKVVAGDVKRVHMARAPGMQEMAMSAVSGDARGMTEESFFEYHLYSLGRRTDLANNETKQISLLSRDNVSVSKKLSVESMSQVYGFDRSEIKSNAKVTLRLENSEENGLGMALPGGRVRVYKADSSGTLQLIGEERIKHTARDERLDLTMGQSFDVVAERKQTAFRKRGERESEVSYSVDIRNHKGETQEVTLVEHISGDWIITQESQQHSKVNAGTIEYQVSVPARGSSNVSYTARINW